MATQNTRSRLTYVFAAALSLAACAKDHPTPAAAGSASSSSSGSSSGDACAAATIAATTTVLDAVAAHRACTTDADCVVVEVHASCFDACTRAVARDGVDAVAAAREATETGACATFATEACTLVAPPCAPPASPTCVSGACE